MFSPEPRFELKVNEFDGQLEEDISNIFELVVRPAFFGMNPWSQKCAKDSLKFYLSGKSPEVVKQLVDEAPNSGEIDYELFLKTLWKVLFDNENFDSLECDKYVEVLDLDGANRYKDALYQDFIRSKQR